MRVREIVVEVSCIVLSSIFFVSGMVKLNDPLGFSYKLEEYFSPGVLNLPFLKEWALFLAIFISALEVFLAFCLIFWKFMKYARWILLGLMTFFTFLTFYSAYFDVVKECGCFGDAIKLTPWQSFSKDVILMVILMPLVLIPWSILEDIRSSIPRTIRIVIADFIIIIAFAIFILDNFWQLILYYIVSILAIFGISFLLMSEEKAAVITSAILAIIPGIYTYGYSLPIKDYLPYKVGNNIPELTVIPPNAPKDEYEIELYYRNKATGEVRKFSTKDAPWQDTATWQWVETKQKLIKKGYTPPISDFVAMNIQGEDVTEDLLNENHSIWVVSYDLSKSSSKAFVKLRRITENLMSKGIKVYLLTSSPKEEAIKFLAEKDLHWIPIFMDGVVLKSMVRANPGVLLVSKGTILGKWHHRTLFLGKKISKKIS